MSGRSRGKGEGSVYYNAERGNWIAQVRIEGRKVKRSAKTEQAAIRLLSNMRGERDRGGDLRRITVSDFLDQWIAYKETDGTRTNTLSGYRGRVKALKAALGKIPLSQLTPRKVEAMTARMVAAGKSPRTAAHHRAVLSNALNDALRWQHVTTNAADIARAPRIPASEREPLMPEEIKALYAAMEGDPWRGVYTLAAALGMRQGEVLALRWSDVDFENNALRLRQTVRRVKGPRDVYEPTKSGRSRPLPLTATVRRVLYERASEQAAEAEAARAFGDAWENPHGLVFTGPVGQSLAPNSVLKRLRVFLKAAGLRESVTFHDLRHSCGSALAHEKVHPSIAQRILGHSNIRTTLDIYTHVLDDDVREAADLIDRAFASDGAT